MQDFQSSALRKIEVTISFKFFLRGLWRKHYLNRFVLKHNTDIKEIRNRGKIPIIVGGTAYYVESVLFVDNMIKTESKNFLCHF